MRVRRFDWAPPVELAGRMREWFAGSAPEVDLAPIERRLAEGGDAALLELTLRFDATEAAPASLRVPLEEAEAQVERLEPDVREALAISIANVRAVAEAQLADDPRTVALPQGQEVTVGQVPVRSAAIYAPGGRASYPSTVVMGAVAARAAGVERLAVASPPRPDGTVHPVTLAAAAMCGADEIYGIGGAQAIFALARGTETIPPVDVIAGPGNSWVQAAKRAVFGEVGIDSLAGPSDLMVIFDGGADPALCALDLCAQAEHGAESPLVVVAVEPDAAGPLLAEVERVAAEHPSVEDAPLALAVAPGDEAALELADAFAPEHLQLMSPGSVALAGRPRTAGCVFVGSESGTAFGDYAAGSNHVLPTEGTGRFFGPLGPGTFRRPTARVSLSAQAAAELAGPVDALARAEGLPVHGLSALARKRSET